MENGEPAGPISNRVLQRRYGKVQPILAIVRFGGRILLPECVVHQWPQAGETRSDLWASRKGSGANLKGSALGGNGWGDGMNIGAGSLQGSTFRPRNHHPVHQVVQSVSRQARS